MKPKAEVINKIHVNKTYHLGTTAFDGKLRMYHTRCATDYNIWHGEIEHRYVRRRRGPHDFRNSYAYKCYSCNAEVKNQEVIDKAKFMGVFK